jgi:3-hydroxyisobutyrate dehydrogenase-like beta-hydroxyacid dehydrogenase
VSPTAAVLHPGQMGAAVAGALRAGGSRTLWLPPGRSAATRARAERAGLEPVRDLRALLAADVVFSVCPPAAAESVAREVAERGFSGIFVDANAVSPARFGRIAERVAAGGARVVDGSLFGPRENGDDTRLYLAGDTPDRDAVAELFAGTAVTAIAMDEGPGSASALKMAHTTFQKAARALAALAHALAADAGVSRHLQREAEGLGSALSQADRLPGVAVRAWRWAPEMREAADSLAAHGLPPEMAIAAADVLALWEHDRDPAGLTVDTVLDRLRAGAPPGGLTA